jgi:hypothetical protein
VAALAALSVLVGGAACAPSVGDGDLTDGWTTMADATVRVPEVAKCYTVSSRGRDVYTPTWFRPTACTDSHTAETFHVGQLPPQVTAPPTFGDRDYWAAYDECEGRSTTFLGGDWYTARLYLSVFVPAAPQWEVGARWYACQLMETRNVVFATAVPRTASLQNALAEATALTHRCTNVLGLTEKTWLDMESIDCAEPHDAEFAGAFKVRGITAPTGDQREATFDLCWDVVATYLAGTVDGMRVGYIPWGMNETDWLRGDRWVRCFAWSSPQKTRGSVKGLGDRTPPG